MAERIFLRYEKTGVCKYISHLDFVRCMNRTLRRAGIPIAYSQGFNPHPELTFALALPVGTTSRCELLELTLAEAMPIDEIIERLNRTVPNGLRFTSGGASPGKKLLAGITAAVYRVEPTTMPSVSQLSAFLNKESIITSKKTKSGIRDTDIRKDIHNIEIDGSRLIMTLAAGNTANLKPATVIQALEEHIDGYVPGECGVERISILNENGAI